MIEAKYEKIGDVAVVTMANPPANTFTMELGAGLEGAVRRAVAEEARGLVLQADGPLFCGGADVRIFAGTTAGQAREMFAGGFRQIDALDESRDMQYAVELLLTQGARKFSQNHAEVVFEGR